MFIIPFFNFYVSLQELVVSSPSERNWRGIFIALLVIVAVLGLIVFSIVLVSPPEEGPRTKGNKPTLEDIFIKIPPPARFNGTWISGNQFYSFVQINTIFALIKCQNQSR